MAFRAIKGGFSIFFANEWGISVQFKYGNYCNNYMNRDVENQHVMDWATVVAERVRVGAPPAEPIECDNAEVAFIAPDGRLDFIPEWGDQVKGYCTPEQVAQFMVEVSQRTEKHARPFPGSHYDTESN